MPTYQVSDVSEDDSKRIECQHTDRVDCYPITCGLPATKRLMVTWPEKDGAGPAFYYFCDDHIDEHNHSGKTALEVAADGREATVATSDARIRGNKADIITAMRQDMAVIERGWVLGADLRMRGAELAAKAMRLRQLIDREAGDG